jgi:glycosyltransferase involved in cell wall biosynthesis
MKAKNCPDQSFRILHIEWSSGWGGQEQRIILECKKIMEMGHFVIIGCQPGSGLMERAIQAGIHVEKLVIRQSYDIKAILDTFRLIKKHAINVINTHSGKDTWVGGVAAKLAGSPLFVRTRHLAIPISNNPFNFIHKLADGIITTGEAVKNALINNNGYPAERIASIATGVPLDRFARTEDDGSLRKELAIDKNVRIVTIVAILRNVKRHDIFLDSVLVLKNRYKDLKFLIVGEGPMRQSIESKIIDNGLQNDVIMTGHREDIPRILAASDIIVLTSDKEGVPQSLSQAMAMGKPVVASAVGGIPDLIDDGVTGLFAEPGNASSYADKISVLLENDELRSRIALEGQKHVLNNFTDTIMANKTIDFYRKLAEFRLITTKKIR